MAAHTSIRFCDDVYDLGILEATVAEFRDVARIEVEHGDGHAVVTLSCDDAEHVAGMLANIVLARTIEVRS